MKQSKFLTRGDVGPGVLVTIRELVQENVAMADDPEQLKWCLVFDECEKPLVINATNSAIISSILKSEETDEWVGRKIVLYDDPTIMFKGKVVGGIRVRAPRGQAANAAAPARPKTADTPSPKPRPAPAASRAAPEPEPVPEGGDPETPF
jgi:hypothetical protein